MFCLFRVTSCQWAVSVGHLNENFTLYSISISQTTFLMEWIKFMLILHYINRPLHSGTSAGERQSRSFPGSSQPQCYTWSKQPEHETKPAVCKRTFNILIIMTIFNLDNHIFYYYIPNMSALPYTELACSRPVVEKIF